MNRTVSTEKDFLLSDLKKMGDLVEENIRGAVKAWQNFDLELAREITENDGAVNNYQIVMQKGITELISTNRMGTSDSRLAVSFLKIANDLERVGDYAVNIAETVLEFKENKSVEYPLILHLSEIALEMLKVSLQAFLEKNVDLAEAVCRKDDTADDYYQEIYESIVREMHKDINCHRVNLALRYIRIIGWLERVADHAVNIGEETIFISTGKIVRY